MTRFVEKPIFWFIIVAALTSAAMRAFPAYSGVGIWIISALGVLLGVIMVVRPERSGLNSHPTGVRLAGIFILCVWAFLLARDLIHFVQGA